MKRELGVRQRARSIGGAITGCLLALPAGACVTVPADPGMTPDQVVRVATAPTSPDELTQLADQINHPDPFYKTQVDVGLGVRIAGGGALQVTITNKTGRNLTVKAQNFGIIPAGSNHGTMVSDQADTEGFPTTTLPPGGKVTGRIIFSGPAYGGIDASSLVQQGNRLIFVHPGCHEALAMIP